MPQPFNLIPRSHICQLVGLDSMARTTHIHDQCLVLQVHRKNLLNGRCLQPPVDLHAILNDLRLKLQWQSTGRLQGIQNPDIALKDCGRRASQIGSHNMKRLRGVRNPGFRQINPMLLKGSTNDDLKGIHRVQTFHPRSLPELSQPNRRSNIVQTDFLKEFLNIGGGNPVGQSRSQNGSNTDSLDSLRKLHFLNLCQPLQSTDQHKPTNASPTECNCGKHFYLMGSRDVECS